MQRDNSSKVKWDVWYARVGYRERAGEKQRPVVVFGGDGSVVEALPIYGSPSSNADYELQEWANAGLRKPSGVSLLPVKINEDSFDRRAGRLNVADIRKIIKQMSE